MAVLSDGVFLALRGVMVGQPQGVKVLVPAGSWHGIEVQV